MPRQSSKAAKGPAVSPLPAVEPPPGLAAPSGAKVLFLCQSSLCSVGLADKRQGITELSPETNSSTSASAQNIVADAPLKGGSCVATSNKEPCVQEVPKDKEAELRALALRKHERRPETDEAPAADAAAAKSEPHACLLLPCTIIASQDDQLRKHKRRLDADEAPAADAAAVKGAPSIAACNPAAAAVEVHTCIRAGMLRAQLRHLLQPFPPPKVLHCPVLLLLLLLLLLARERKHATVGI